MVIKQGSVGFDGLKCSYQIRSRQQLMARSSMEDRSVGSHVRAILRVQILTTVCCVPTLLFVFLKGLVPCGSDWVDGSMPQLNFLRHPKLAVEIWRSTFFTICPSR